MLAMVVNDNAGNLTLRGALETIASVLAPTGKRKAKKSPTKRPGSL
ncbi:hypothetical protein [Pseudomonas putida]